LDFRGSAGRPIRIDNNLMAGPSNFSIDPSGQDVSILLTRNTLFATHGMQFYVPAVELAVQEGRDPVANRPIQVELSANILDLKWWVVQFQLGRSDGIQPDAAKARVQRGFRWQEQHNVLSLRREGAVAVVRASPMSGENYTAASVDTHAEWKQLWGLADDAALEGTLRYQGGDLWRTADAAPQQLTPEDFRLHADSAGYRAGKDGEDLGADVDLVGPGPAYERWKKTPEYEEWLKETDGE
jgi:hypothetical protein